MRVLLGRISLIVGSSLSSFQIYHAIPFWLVKFLFRNPLATFWEFPCMLFVIFPLLLLIFYQSLIFVCLITMCLSVFLLGFFLPGILCASWTWLTISHPTLGKFSTIISSNIFLGPSSLFLLGPSNMNVGVIDVVPVVSQAVFFFFFFTFFFPITNLGSLHDSRGTSLVYLFSSWCVPTWWIRDLILA